MVLGRSQSTDSTTSGGRHLRDSDVMACSELLLGPGDPIMPAATSSAAVAAALTVDLAAAVAGSVSNQQLHSGMLDLSQSGEGGEDGRHMPHPWMRPEVAATIRTIHNNKKATIRQHYYPEGNPHAHYQSQLRWKFNYILCF